MLKDKIHNLANRCYQWLSTHNSIIESRPLVKKERITEIKQIADSLPFPLIQFQKPVLHQQTGELPSHYRGRGLEFEENRLYQTGDEQRLINWRLYARSGKLYTKIYTEERRPEIYLVVDRRARMRFGTHKQLKVTLATEIALSYLYQACKLNIPTGGVLIESELNWFHPSSGQLSIDYLINNLTAPCPPVPFDSTEITDIDILDQIIQRIPAGCFILFISDFNLPNLKDITPRLFNLSNRFNVHSYQVIDTAEENLPENGDFILCNDKTNQPLHISGHNTQQKEQYFKFISTYQTSLHDCFKACNLSLKTCYTTDSLETCLEQYAYG